MRCDHKTHSNSCAAPMRLAIGTRIAHPEKCRAAGVARDPTRDGATMIEIRDKQILIDDKPRLLIGGEVHYFRLKRDEWQDRISKLKAANCNMVASYIPWLC